MWKLARQALPLSAIMASRFHNDPSYATCGGQWEDVGHLLFTCPFSQGCWLVSLLALRSEELWQELQEGPQFLIEQLTEEQWTIFANVCWSIWRCRNAKAYGGEILDVEKFIKYLNQVALETQISASGKFLYMKGVQSEIRPLNVVRCFVDGAWVQNWKGGVGVVIFKGEELLLHKSKAVQSISPLQSEALALWEGILEIQKLGVSNCSFLTDSKHLADLISQLHPPIDAEWKAFNVIQQIWLKLKQNGGYECQFIQREGNDIANFLARKERLQKWNSVAFTFPLYQDYV